MAGHSHWANIQHKKAAIDKKRGKIFSKISRKIIAAAKSGGGDPEANIKLKYAVQAARAANMSNDQVKRAIKRAMGEGAGGADFEELVYEGYAPGGAAVLVEALTDNRNRTSGDVRSTFNKRGGNLGSTGSVAWQFVRKSIICVPAAGISEDDLLMTVLEAGADDLEQVGDLFEIRGAPESLFGLQQAVEQADLETVSAELSYFASEPMPVDDETGQKIAKLLEALEENDDVQNVYTNADFPEGFGE